MKVILLENLKKIGSIGEVIDVKRGFARNFLIANKKALYASKENISKVDKIKNDLSKKDNEKKQNAKKILEKIHKKEYEIKKLCTENNELYGSVKPTEISKLIKEINNQSWPKKSRAWMQSWSSTRRLTNEFEPSNSKVLILIYSPI